jgi:hypothetical protein
LGRAGNQLQVYSDTILWSLRFRVMPIWILFYFVVVSLRRLPVRPDPETRPMSGLPQYVVVDNVTADVNWPMI